MELQKRLDCDCHKITSTGRFLTNLVWDYKKGVVGRQWKPGTKWYEAGVYEDRDGYKVITYLHGPKNLRINRLVALAFVPNPDKHPIVCHRNGDKQDNRARNLYWGTHKTNAADREKHGHTARGKRNGNSKLSPPQLW